MTDNSLIHALHTRRSVLAKDMKAPGPSKDELDAILRAAHRVPDHGKIGPWRFVIFENEARLAFGRHLADIFAQDNPNASEKLIAFERDRFIRAPLVIAVVSSPDLEHKVPRWEQELSAGAACQNILLAAGSLGYGAQWLTEWYAYSTKVDAVLNLEKHERIAGYIYIGSFENAPNERNRPPLESRIVHWANNSE